MPPVAPAIIPSPSPPPHAASDTAKASTEIRFIIVSKGIVVLPKLPVAGAEDARRAGGPEGRNAWGRGDEKSTRPMDARLWTESFWQSITANRLFKTNQTAAWTS